MTADAERLVVLLEARIRDFERNMVKASGAADRSFDRMRRGSRSATAQMEADMVRSSARINQALASVSMQVGSLARTFAVGFAGGVFAGGLSGFTSAIRDTVSQLSKLGNVADMIGMNVEDLQKLRSGFQSIGAEVNQTDTAMRRFSRRVAEAASGSGVLYEVLKANNVELRTADGRMRSQTAILRDYANLIKNAGSDQERLLLAFKAFDAEGSILVNALRDGSDGLDTLMDKAEEAGHVIDEELIRKAQDLDTRWADAWKTFEINAKSSIMTVVAALDNMGTSLDSIHGKFSAMGNSSFFRWILKNMDDAGLISLDLKYGNLGAMDDADMVKKLDDRVQFLIKHVEHLKNIGEDATEAERKLAEARVALEREVKRIMAGPSTGEATTLPKLEIPGTPTIIPGRKSEDDKVLKERISDYERLAQRIRETTSVIQSEMQALAGINPLVNDYGYALEYARTQAQLLNAAQRDGAELTPELRGEIALMADAYATAGAQAAHLREQNSKLVSEFNQMQGIVKKGFTGMLDAMYGDADSFFDRLISGFADVGKSHVELDLKIITRAIKGERA